MADKNNEPKLLIPQLKGFYEWVEPLSLALIRISVGTMILPHGYPS